MVCEKDFMPAEDQDGKTNNQTGGVVDDEHDYGPLPLDFSGDDDRDGRSVLQRNRRHLLGVRARDRKDRSSRPRAASATASRSCRRQGFKKNRADARLKLHVTKVFLRAIDANGGEILYPECPTEPAVRAHDHEPS